MSRLECKENTLNRAFVGKYIRICPDWNVKFSLDKLAKDFKVIRICPDWNVKMTKDNIVSVGTILEYVQIGM